MLSCAKFQKKKKHFSPFSAAYYILIDFQKSYNLLFHTANQVYLTSFEADSMELST